MHPEVLIKGFLGGSAWVRRKSVREMHLGIWEKEGGVAGTLLIVQEKHQVAMIWGWNFA